jgi:6-pyruvoyltetrahydropterin/6-carboxytetrahydropterin synthase
MYTVCVRDHVMIAHSFQGEMFGPAQRLHGATYVVDVEFRKSSLDPDGVVVDIGRASMALREVLHAFQYSNLDERPEFAGVNTTTEYMARYVFEHVRLAIFKGKVGQGAEYVESLRVTLHESHVAWASYEGKLEP